MNQSKIEDLKETIRSELTVIGDDIHVNSGKDSLTFYLPLNQLDKARNVLDSELDVLEEHEHEYLIKLNL